MKPKTLWKYTGIDRIDSAINGLVRFTQPRDLNDPFDVNPEVSQFFTNEKFQKHLKIKSRKEFNKLIANGMKENLISPDSLTEDLENVLFENIQNGGFGVSELIDPIVSAIPDMMSEAWDKAIGIFCLSATNDNILMWSQYGDQHQGIAIGYDSAHPYFNNQGQGLEFKIGAVKYSAKRPHKTSYFNDNYKIFYQKAPIGNTKKNGGYFLHWKIQQ
jgi:hypothetical protein